MVFLFIAAHAVVRKWVLLTDPDDKMAGVKVRNLAFTGRDKPDCFESLSTSTGEVGRAVSCGVIWLLTNKCCTLSLIINLSSRVNAFADMWLFLACVLDYNNIVTSGRLH